MYLLDCRRRHQQQPKGLVSLHKIQLGKEARHHRSLAILDESLDLAMFLVPTNTAITNMIMETIAQFELVSSDMKFLEEINVVNPANNEENKSAEGDGNR